MNNVNQELQHQIEVLRAQKNIELNGPIKEVSNDCPNKCSEYYNNGVSDRAYYEWSIKLDKCKAKSEG